MSELKERILVIMEKNSKVSVADIAILLGETEDNVPEPFRRWSMTRLSAVTIR